MSRQIDWDNLTEDDRAYIADRPWLTPGEPAAPLFVEGVPQPETDTGEVSPDGTISEEVDLAGLGINPEDFAPSDEDETEEDNDDEETESDEDEDAESEETEEADDELVVDYSDLSHADLKAKLQERGLSRAGGKAELIARLEADDELQ